MKKAGDGLLHLKSRKNGNYLLVWKLPALHILLQSYAPAIQERTTTERYQRTNVFATFTSNDFLSFSRIMNDAEKYRHSPSVYRRSRGIRTTVKRLDQ